MHGLMQKTVMKMQLNFSLVLSCDNFLSIFDRVRKAFTTSKKLNKNLNGRRLFLFLFLC